MSGSDVSFDSFDSFDELRLLISGLCDGELTADRVSRLDELVSQDPEARWYYIRYMHVHSNLSRYAQVGTYAGPVSRLGEIVGDDVGLEEEIQPVASIGGGGSSKAFQDGRRVGRTIRGRGRFLLPAMAAAAAVLIVVGLGGWLWPGRAGSGAALATALEQLSTTRVIGFTAEIQRNGRTVETVEAVHLQPDRMRQELPGGGARICDFTRGKMVTIDPARKTVEIKDIASGPRSYSLRDFLDQFKGNVERMRAQRGHTESYLGKRKIDGRLVEGFEMRKPTVVQTLWVDVETGLPARIKLSDPDAPDSNDAPARSITVIRDFRFNVEMDESLFSITPPPGYAVELR